MIGRQLYPLLVEPGFDAVRVSPRMVYADASRPHLVEGFTRRTFTAMMAFPYEWSGNFIGGTDVRQWGTPQIISEPYDVCKREEPVAVEHLVNLAQLTPSWVADCASRALDVRARRPLPGLGARLRAQPTRHVS